jgi:hypothetical protein
MNVVIPLLAIVSRACDGVSCHVSGYGFVVVVVVVVIVVVVIVSTFIQLQL